MFNFTNTGTSEVEECEFAVVSVYEMFKYFPFYQ